MKCPAKHIFAMIWLLMAALPLSLLADDSVRITLDKSGGRHVFRAAGFDSSQLAKMEKANWKSEAASRLLAIYVGQLSGADTKDLQNRQPMLGELRFDGKKLEFHPRFPLRPGLAYTAVLRPQAADVKVTKVFRLPKPKTPPTRVQSVYPTGDVLPENQLRFYIYFSAPMSQGEAYRHIKLYDENGALVEYPFLELGEELWDRAGKRFTLLVDPGRIKQGLKPREDLGPVFETGKSYSMVIDRKWSDVWGNPLKDSYRKPIKITAPDKTQPDPSKWRITPPAASTRTPLTVRLGEPLDFGMLQRVVQVERISKPSPSSASERIKGERIEGQILVDQGERRWRFTPDKPWRPGQYRLVIDVILEDRAGNNIAAPFEVDVFRKVETKIKTKTVTRTFQIRSKTD